MAVTSYLTIAGEIVTETRNGVRADYLPDPLGSTAALTNASQIVTDTFSYWPYGEVRSHVGTSQTSYTYCGTLGYRSDSVGYYARAREFEAEKTRCLTVDPIWPRERAYAYVKGQPVIGSDPSGTSTVGLLSFGVKGGCRVWKCYANHVLGHGCIEVDTPSGACGGSRDTNSFYSCIGAHSDKSSWKCILISTDCDYAASVCSCIAASSGGSPLIEYCRAGGCKQFITNIACCGCHSLPAGKRDMCERSECGPAYWTPPPHANGSMNAGGGCGRPLI